MRYNYRIESFNYGYEKKFGSGSAFAAAGIWYPSYLGIDIFFTQLSDSILGMTNGKRILLKENLREDVKDFVLMHEEEHVKDMSLNEMETDTRALRRFFQKNRKISAEVSALLKKRWGGEADALIRALYGGN